MEYVLDRGMEQARIESLLDFAVALAWRASKVVLANNDRSVRVKKDGSPQTPADIRTHEYLLEELKAEPFAIISEEGEQQPNVADPLSTYWLIDPLDGTSGYLRGEHSFTVNIALMSRYQPMLGVIAAPALGLVYGGCHSLGAFVQKGGNDAPRRSVQCRIPPEKGYKRILLSRNHGTFEQKWLKEQKEKYGPFRRICLSSALKLCLLAHGVADYYLRAGPTHTWDQAAGQAILESAGGRILSLDGNPLDYSRPYCVLPGFLAESL